MIRKEYIFLSLPVIVSVVIKPSIVPTLLYVSLLHTKDSPLSNNRLARNVVVLLQIISDIIIPLNRDAPRAKWLLFYFKLLNLVNKGFFLARYLKSHHVLCMLCYMNIDRGAQIEIIRCRNNCFLTVASAYRLRNFRELIFLRKAIKSLFWEVENVCDNLVAKNNIYFLVASNIIMVWMVACLA